MCKWVLSPPPHRVARSWSTIRWSHAWAPQRAVGVGWRAPRATQRTAPDLACGGCPFVCAYTPESPTILCWLFSGSHILQIKITILFSDTVNVWAVRCIHTYTYLFSYTIYTYTEPLHQLYVYTYIHKYIHTCIHTCIHIDTCRYIQYIHTCIHTYIHIDTYVDTYINTYRYIHYIHTCIHTHCKGDSSTSMDHLSC